MTNRDPDNRYEDPAQVFRFFGQQLLKQVRTALPGTVVSYNRATQRARVDPAVDILLTTGVTVARATLLDVPVLWPSAGGYVIHGPLAAGDLVMLLYQHRNIEAFKQRMSRAAPAAARVMAEQDVVALPGFCGAGFAPVASAGLVMQAQDGSSYIEIAGSAIRLHADSIRLEYDGGTQQYP